MARLPTAPVAAGSLVTGWLVARTTKKRPLGGALAAVAAAWCFRRWWRQAGLGPAAALLGVYAAALGGSHPLAKRIGAWPSVLSVAGVAGAASWLVADRRRSVEPPAGRFRPERSG